MKPAYPRTKYIYANPRDKPCGGLKPGCSDSQQQEYYYAGKTSHVNFLLLQVKDEVSAEDIVSEYGLINLSLKLINDLAMAFCIK